MTRSRQRFAEAYGFLPDDVRKDLAKAVRLEKVTIGIQLVVTALVALVSGESQAMKVAWTEDLLSVLPPLAFLIATRRIRRRPSAEYPYGHHRSIGVAHLVAASALFAMGLYLVIDSGIGLIKAERPPLGIVVLFGYPLWSGWLMVAVMALTNIPAVILGRMKLALAKPLHDKVLYADAKMNKADWSSALATIVGILGIGIGWWWADSAAALLVSVSILHDGVSNVRAAVAGLTDARARAYDDSEPHPLIRRIEDEVAALDWVSEVSSRVRDEGHLFHVELFVVPASGPAVSVQACVDLVEHLRALDWKLHDIVVIPVPELPRDQALPRELPDDDSR
ncbi:cation transporter [Propionimicrobium sp. PCR01-08-3]|uniref:cation transporter n=1 Tax=Propionimicrobium sp. PCR01-08-3 TaxID=3052086 RepID=UPI00255CBC36|nr:cation transporter [Propionimicrobium sp. PCR01-08-3]WIY82431.1 cation transporter [Propionimicrobium sp. PCR01-08-3]